LNSGLVNEDEKSTVLAAIEVTKEKIQKLWCQKNRNIGSATISQENWIQDLDDEMGQIMRGACRRI